MPLKATSKLIPNKAYVIPKDDFVVFGDAILRAVPLLLNDRIGSTQRKAVEEYFSRGFAIFAERLQELKNTQTSLPARREKELMFMLDALISAKRMLSEE